MYVGSKDKLFIQVLNQYLRLSSIYILLFKLMCVGQYLIPMIGVTRGTHSHTYTLGEFYQPAGTGRSRSMPRAIYRQQDPTIHPQHNIPETGA